MNKENNTGDHQIAQQTNMPVAYCDSVIGIAVGPFVSKLVLGIEGLNQKNIPSLQISMPTNALYDLAIHILEVLRDPETSKSIAAGHGSYQKAVEQSK